jgi:hypothetical protein
MTIWSHVPSAVRRFDVTQCGGNVGMVKDFVVAVRVNSVQNARHHRTMTFRQSFGSNAEDEDSRQGNLGPCAGNFHRSIFCYRVLYRIS